jgi:hypothetical protein
MMAGLRARIVAWWRQAWTRRLRTGSEAFRSSLAELDERIDEMLVVQKRCSALTPTPFGKDGDR